MKKNSRNAQLFGAVLTAQNTKETQPGFFQRHWRTLLFVALAVVLLFCLIRLVVYLAQTAQTNRTAEELRAQVVVEAAATMPPVTDAPAAVPAAEPETTVVPLPTVADTPLPAPSATPAAPVYQYIGTEDEILHELRKAYQRNNDMVGWLKIPGVVDLPVVYRDNSYYLYRDFDGNDQIAGTLFLDYLHPFQANTQQLVIHGHNMRDGSMFGHLLRYKKRDFTVKHTVITWKTLYREETYDVFAVVQTTIDPQDARYISYLGKARFKTEESFKALMDQYRGQALYWRDMNVKSSDALLTLSTCIGDDRLLVVAKRREK